MRRNARVVDVVGAASSHPTVSETFESRGNSGALLGYAQEPLLPLSKACAPLAEILYNLMFYVQVAIDKTPEVPPDGLTVDESAAIRLYTIEWGGGHRSLYTMLNRALMRGNAEDLRPYFKYLKLFFTALAKLPCAPLLTVWRGVTKDLSAQLPGGTSLTWWACSSCTTELTVLESNMYLGSAGERTLFSIESINGRAIKGHSRYKRENEILLLPGTQLVVQSQFSPAPDLHIIHLKQVRPKEVLVEPPFKGALLYPKLKSPWYRQKKYLSLLSLLTALIIAAIVVGAVLGARESASELTGSPWQADGMTVAGGRGRDNQSNQVRGPYQIYVDEDQAVYVLEYNNSRLTKWKRWANEGELVVGRNGDGNRTDQLSYPVDMIVNKEENSVIITDVDGRRVVQWPLENGVSGTTLIADGNSIGLAMDKEGYLYISDNEKHEVRRWKAGEDGATVVAGGNGRGSGNNQLNGPLYLFVDEDYSLYVTDSANHRVMKWLRGAKEGIVVAGCGAPGVSLTCLLDPRGIFVDESGTLYVADAGNHRVMRWPKDVRLGNLVVGGNNMGNRSDQLSWPIALAFDAEKNLYVADYNNNRVQRFELKVNG